MLADIRICFDKTLKPVDCNGIMKSRRKTRNTQPLTNCDVNKPILYLESDFYHVSEDNIPTVLNSTDTNSTNINSINTNATVTSIESKKQNT